MACGVVRTFQGVITSEWKTHRATEMKYFDSSEHDTGNWNGKLQLRHFVSGCNPLDHSACLEHFQRWCIVDSGETLRQTGNGEMVWGRSAAQTAAGPRPWGRNTRALKPGSVTAGLTIYLE